MGGMVRLVFDAEHTPSGVQAAPIVAKALELADETWDTGIGELIPATPAH